MGLLTDKIALVTGASRGIGAGIAQALANAGAKVAVHGRDHEALQTVEQIITKAGGTALAITAELTEFDAIEAMRQQIEQIWGPIDILVANAGGSITPPAPIESIPEDGWRATIEGNLTATFLTLKSFVPSMKARKTGNIIIISSSAGRRPHAEAPIPYGVAKAGIVMLTKNVAAQLAPSGIRVNCIAPATIMTERNRQRIPTDRQQAMLQQHPLGRLGTPADVAKAAVFLASDDAGWITGIVLDVAGGSVMV